MPDQTPEVCACGHDRWSHGNDLLCAGCPPHERHPFRPAERPEGPVVEGESMFQRFLNAWAEDGKRDDMAADLEVLTRAISSAAVAEARAEWEEGHDMHCLWADDHARAEAAERALEEVREALRAFQGRGSHG